MAAYLEEYIMSESRYNLQNANILETIITIEELKEMILKLDNFLMEIK